MVRRAHRRLSFLAAVAVVSVALVSAPARAELRVVTTTTDLAAIAAAVGGDKVSVRAMAPAQQDPHDVDPRPSLVVALSRADLLVFNGVELEVGWLPPLLQNARNTAIRPGSTGSFDASRHVRLLEVRGQVDRSEGDVHPGGNPHFLLDPRAGAAVARALAERMASLRPAEAAGFRARGAQLASQLEAFAAQQTKRFAGLAAERRRVVTYHRSMVYLIAWLGLERPASVEPKPGVAPSPAHVARLLQTMRRMKIRALLQERYYPARTSTTLARMAKAKLVMLPGGTEFDAKQTYMQRMRRTVDGIYDALAK